MKANYLSILVYAKDLTNYELLADRVQNVLLSANGYYFAGADKEAQEILNKDNMNIFMEVQKVLESRNPKPNKVGEMLKELAKQITAMKQEELNALLDSIHVKSADIATFAELERAIMDKKNES
jgi:molybdopterin converting factor small subunit